MVELGYNYRMTDMQAALGISQLNKLDQFIERRREIASIYNDALSEIPGIIIPKQLEGTESGWLLYMIQLDSSILKKTRKTIFQEMRALNIGVHVHYIPVYWHPYYQKIGYKKRLCPKAERYYEQALTLPIFPRMNKKDIYDVVNALKEVVG